LFPVARLAVEADGRTVSDPDLEGEEGGAARPRDALGIGEEAASGAGSAGFTIDGNGIEASPSAAAAKEDKRIAGEAAALDKDPERRGWRAGKAPEAPPRQAIAGKGPRFQKGKIFNVGWRRVAKGQLSPIVRGRTTRFFPAAM
jgi:hypothetical protein